MIVGRCLPSANIQTIQHGTAGKNKTRSVQEPNGSHEWQAGGVMFEMDEPSTACQSSKIAPIQAVHWMGLLGHGRMNALYMSRP